MNKNTIKELNLESYNDNKYYYSYDFLQVKYLIKNKCTVVGVGIGDRNEDLWFRFIRNDKLTQLINNWLNK